MTAQECSKMDLNLAGGRDKARGGEGGERAGTPWIRIVGVGDLVVSQSPTDTLVTYSLGSCLAVAAYDPQVKAGGLLHAMLPTMKGRGTRLGQPAAKFVDSGVALLLKRLYAMGCRSRRLVVAVVGGARMMDPNGFFRIGQRNYACCRKILWKNNILIAAEDVGGTATRTVELRMADGTLRVRADGVYREL